MLFKSQTHQDIWIGHHCERCYHGQQPNPCKIVTWALAHGRKPVEWDRNTRKNATMAESIRCNAETRQPPLVVKPTVDVDVPMFDVAATVDMDDDHA